jgi:hypothetical protein
VEKVIIRTYPDRYKAELARKVLLTHGIQALVTAKDVSAPRPSLTERSGFALVVDRDEANQARSLLPE